ncbi:Succinate dehydrogenase [ubiquinone] cytochrome b small subunit, mitochondrial [Cryomyces minteri]|uniref:Succinate dehydrogenase [ubiquinone] cytochrome b small subunit n=1 Tax=Cryomyces minteri TaxID=331657 RepID=A0A4V5NEH3_9PEZI|nr:Succinate dehydrogenase [ubiquinone] cytochrome b small subunit, mitochondrial [Cryomyces minteri]
MALIARPSLLRQVCTAAPSKRSLSTKAFATPSIHAASTSTIRHAPQSVLIQNTLPGYNSVAAFHAGGRQAILPPLPQRIQGTINDAAIVPDPTPAHGSYHWTFERLIAGALVPLTIAPFAAGSLNPIMDATFCAAILVHSHIGFESIIIDYVPTHRMPKTRKALMWALKAGTLAVGVGLYEFETNDVVT